MLEADPPSESLHSTRSTGRGVENQNQETTERHISEESPSNYLDPVQRKILKNDR